MDECEVTLMPIDQCAHCKGTTLEDDWSDVVIVSRFRARYDGRSACGHLIVAGDLVAWTDANELLCRECGR